MPRNQSARKQAKRVPRSKDSRNQKESPFQRIYLWRLECLERAGMPRSLAKKIADSEFDLHRALDMLAAGCTPETLLDIAL